ncbi:hypothetical protein DFH09DRAFT_1369547, partial [Mycena vulgaris]
MLLSGISSSGLIFPAAAVTRRVRQSQPVRAPRLCRQSQLRGPLPGSDRVYEGISFFFGVWFEGVGVGLAVEVDAEGLGVRFCSPKYSLPPPVFPKAAGSSNSRRKKTRSALCASCPRCRSSGAPSSSARTARPKRASATPVPGKIGMAMAGQGLNAAPPPRPASHNYFKTQANPGNPDARPSSSGSASSSAPAATAGAGKLPAEMMVLPAETMALLSELEDRTVAAERARDEAQARTTLLADNWTQLASYLAVVDARAAD